MADRYGERQWVPERNRYDDDRERWRRYGHERGFFDRAGDEVRSWFGDDEAQRRRMMDEREGQGYGERGYERGSGGRWSGERGSGRERSGDEWGFGPWPGGRQLDAEWRQWGIDPSSRRGGGYGESRPTGAGWTEWGDVRSWFGGQSERERRGPHAGRGPRGYQRSDDRIKEEVCERMAYHGDLDASEIEVRVANAEVTLVGTVDSRRAKRLAEDLADDVFGVREIHNQLRVASDTQPETQRGRQGPGERRVA